MQKISESFAHLTRRIVSSLADTIERHELAIPIGEAPPSAYRLYLEGKRLIAQTDLQHLRQARKWFKSSLNRYEHFSAAHAGMSRALGMEWLIRGMRDKELLDEANGAARQAQQSDPNSGRAYRELGFVALYRRRFDESLEYFQQAQISIPTMPISSPISPTRYPMMAISIEHWSSAVLPSNSIRCRQTIITGTSAASTSCAKNMKWRSRRWSR